MLLHDVSNDRNNNLNIIRFIAAIMVIYAHSFALSSKTRDPLSEVANGQTSFGGLAVCVFFFFSGFLITRSVSKSHSLFEFMKNRIIRIFPPLIVVVSLSAFVLGGLVSEFDIHEYYMNKQTYLYLTNAIFILRHNLPGVFEYNVYGKVVNGSLWTIPVEFICYIICYCMFRLGILKEKRMIYTIPFLGFFYCVLDIVLKEYPLIKSVLVPCTMFYMGMMYYTYCNRICIYFQGVLLCIVGLLISAFGGVWRFGVVLFLPYILIYLSFGTKKKMGGFGKKYEISYGMYLSAFPIQQTIVMMNGGRMNHNLNFLFSVPFVMLSGFLINLLIEKPLQKFAMNVRNG